MKKGKAHTKTIKTRIDKTELVRKAHKRLFEAASELFSKKGYHGTTMRQISDVSGINLSHIYNYISSKDDILYLYYRMLNEQWAELYEKHLSSIDESPVHQIRKFTRATLEYIHMLESEVLTMYTESRHLNKDSLYSVLSVESKNVNLLEKVIIRGEQEGYFRPLDSFMAANIIQYLMVIRPLRGWNFNKRYTFNRFVSLIIQSILRMLGCEEGVELNGE